ncbi:14771_t:CDS:2 [Dentiscutata heterogama]|uniref:14771_t:CDS:1 n=1 Tax=Dentiscutata heterogama TaxID=1316150 RepID=A0ACA9JY83_9GLOM|nr:14771_t:CDS:2 [Dentiscutata heterogama]
MEKNDVINKNYNIKTESANQDDSESRTTNVTNNKCILSVDDDYIKNTLISKLQNLAI